MLKHAVAAAVLAVALPAVASANPTLRPTRDVVVQYNVSGSAGGPGKSSEVTIHYKAGGQRMRIEPQGQPGYMIVDRTTGHMDMVMPAQRVYMDLPYDPKKIMNFEQNDARFSRRGTDTVAGLQCTVYDVENRGHSGQVCLTDDGVMLRAHGGGAQHSGRLRAVKVTYETQPDSLFTPPPGFHKMDAQHLPQAGGRAGH